MKSFFLVPLALSSSLVFAAEVDYSRCGMLAGVQLDHDGKVVESPFQPIKNKRVEGNKEHIVFESSFGSQKFETQVTLERDSEGRVIRSTMGGERPSASTLKQYRESMVNGAVMMAPMSAGHQTFAGKDYFMTQEPQYWVKKSKVSSPDENTKTVGNVTVGFMGMDPNYEMITLSKLSPEQAKEVGIDNVEELKRLRQQWKRDKKTTAKLREGFTKVVDRSALVIPMGSDSEFEIKDGVCLPKSTSSRFYNSQSGQVNTLPVSSRERCDKIRKIYKRHERKIQDCGQVSKQVASDYFIEEGGLVGGFQSGGRTGGAPTQQVYPSMGLAGGMVSGFVGGMGIGMGGGMYPGAGFGAWGMGGMMGSDMASIQAQSQMCEYMYEYESSQNSFRQGSSGGKGTEVKSE